ncbi:Hsp20/alpha crystallin family protein [Methanoregula sp.]|uniref:Hsp20/alpha crystallin family protein n=1 Tax=Methanoregula sp. TaxID=2052170 RepID=UPI003561417D
MSIDNKDLFNAINGLMDRLMAEMGENSPSFQPHIVGYRIVIDGVPVAPGTPGSAPTDGADQPAPEVDRIGDEVFVVASLPGVSEESLNLTCNGETLVIEGTSSLGTCHATTPLPPVDPATMKHALKHGVLEVTFKALPEAAETGETPEPEKTG